MPKAEQEVRIFTMATSGFMLFNIMVLKVPIDLDVISFGEYPPSKAAQVTTAFFQARQGVLQVKSISCCINQIIRAVEIETSNSKPLLATSSWILFSSSKLDAIAHACNAPVTVIELNLVFLLIIH